MNTILEAEVISGKTKFIIQGDLPYPHKQIGNTFSGTLRLEQIDASIFQLKIYEAEVIAATNGNDWIGLFSLFTKESSKPNGDICFKYSTGELERKEKVFSYWSIEDDQLYIECFDMKTLTGCWFRFYDKEIANSFARELNIKNRSIFNENNDVNKDETI